MTTGLPDFFKYNLWANLRLLDACAPLSEAQLDATTRGTFGSVRETLMHLFAAEEGYVRHFTGTSLCWLLGTSVLKISRFLRADVLSTMPLQGREEDDTSHRKRKSGSSMRRHEGRSQHRIEDALHDVRLSHCLLPIV
jgi:hypothetical protein